MMGVRDGEAAFGNNSTRLRKSECGGGCGKAASTMVWGGVSLGCAGVETLANITTGKAAPKSELRVAADRLTAVAEGRIGFPTPTEGQLTRTREF